MTAYTAFQEAFQEDFKYSDFLRDQASQHIGDVRREFIYCGLEMGLEKAVLNPSHLRPAQQELQNRGTKVNTVLFLHAHIYTNFPIQIL